MAIAVARGRSTWRDKLAGCLLACAALMLVSCKAPVAPAPEEAIPDVVARVDGEPVTRVELQRMVANPLTREQARQDLRGGAPSLADLQRLALRKLIHLRLLVQEARRRNIIVTDGELDQAIVSLRRGFPDLKSFGVWMQGQGLSEPAFFEAVRADLAAERVSAALVDHVRVPESLVREYHGAHLEDFRPEEVRLQIIAVRDEAAAREIVTALRRGEPFGRMARQRSSGVRARQGGDTGWVPYDSLAPPLREAVAKLTPGEARGPLRRGSELLIVRLSDRRRGAARSLTEAAPEIERRLLPGLRQEALEAWLSERRRSSRIEVLYHPPSGGSLTETGAQARASASAQWR